MFVFAPLWGFFMPWEIPVTKQDPAAYLFDPEADPGPPDAGRDAVGATENPDPTEPEDAGCGCAGEEGRQNA